MSRKLPKAVVRVNEEVEGRMAVNGASGWIGKGQAPVLPKPSQSRKSLISHIDYELDRPLLLQGSHEAKSGKKGIYLTEI